MTREEAIKKLSCIADEMPSMECADWIEAINMAIKALEQEPKTGEWIEGGTEEGAFGFVYTRYKCSCCGWEHSLLIPKNYCPNCGRRMVEPTGAERSEG